MAKLVTTKQLTDSDFMDILDSTAENNQINWLLGDSDVRDLILPIFKKYGDHLNTEQYNTIAHGLGLETRRAQPFDDEYDEMEAAAEYWIELQSDIARGR